ncbi:hypothetical protein B0H16DRAFT_1515117, partial [Mycena metata]
SRRIHLLRRRCHILDAARRSFEVVRIGAVTILAGVGLVAVSRQVSERWRWLPALSIYQIISLGLLSGFVIVLRTC